MTGVQHVAACVVVAILILIVYGDRRKVYNMHMIRDDKGNEHLVLDARIGSSKGLFMLDTGFAGAPVLSLSYLATLRRHPSMLTRGSVVQRFHRTMHALKKPAAEEEMQPAMSYFISKSGCRTFTSGCTMRLMGIGSTQESQADLLMCPPAKFTGSIRASRFGIGSWDADVFVTNTLEQSIHILTSDYLIHNSPCIIECSRRRLVLNATMFTMIHTFDRFPVVLAGGAFIVPVMVGEEVLQVVVDTGASATMSVSKNVGARLQGVQSSNMTVQQMGVNGERICSDIVKTDVKVGSHTLKHVDILVNNKDVDGADGYMGMGILRCFDIYIDKDVIGFRRNRLHQRNVEFAKNGSCSSNE